MINFRYHVVSLTAVFLALAVGLGWGIRGDFGHLLGAMYPGAALALGLAFVSGQRSLFLWMPIIAALSRQAVEDAWLEYEEQLRSLGARRFGAALTLVWDIRFSLVTAVLAGLGRASAEVGAVMIVGGNIDGVTRVMTTTIALETSKGDLPLALSLGLVLIALVLVLNALAQLVKDAAQRRFG